MSEALGRGSILQMFLSTTPILGLLCYFLYLAQQRPNHQRYNLTDDADDGQIISAYNDPLIAMIEMLYVFLSIAVFWVWLLSYLLYFVPKRRSLIRSYLDKNIKSILGDVSYEEYYGSRFRKILSSFLRSEYAYVTYTLDRRMCVNDDFVDATFFDSWKCGTDINGNDEEERNCTNEHVTGVVVQKKIRTYLSFDREQVTVLVHPKKPLSGIPRADIEADVGFQVDHDSITSIQRIAIFWIIFSFSGAIYILKRMELVDDKYENDEWGWKVFTIVVVILLPLTSIGLNSFYFYNYKLFLLDQGIVRPILDGSSVGGDYVQIQ